MQLLDNSPYPYLVFYRSRMTAEIFAIQINNNRESTSIYGFENLQKKPTYSLCYEKKLGFSAYNGSYTQEDENMIEILASTYPERKDYVRHWNDILFSVDNNKYNLYDFYEKIGFDRKTRKINGKTWLSYLKMESKKEVKHYF